jgi:DNA-binding MarR family transcriptional regulator
MKQELGFDFLHSLFMLKSLLGFEFGKNTKSESSSINMAEYVLMKAVSKSTNGNVCLADIREYLAVTKAAVSQILSSLEKRKFLIRNIDKNDRRNLIVILTPAGKDALQQKDAKVNNRLDELVSDMGEDDTRTLIRLITKMNNAITASKDKTI